MAYLVETSILARLANTSDVYYPVATRAVLILHHQGESLRTSPQNLIEFRNCATRPANVNGLGLPHVGADDASLLPEAGHAIRIEGPSTLTIGIASMIAWAI